MSYGYVEEMCVCDGMLLTQARSVFYPYFTRDLKAGGILTREVLQLSLAILSYRSGADQIKVYYFGRVIHHQRLI